MVEDSDLPRFWLICKLSNCLELNQSGVWGDEPRNDDSDFPVLRSTNIQDGKLILENVAYRSIQPKLAEKYALHSGDILVTKSSGSLHLIGKNALFESTKDDKTYLFSNFTQRLRINANLALPYYIYFYLNSVYAQSFMERMHSTTSGLRNLNMNLYALQKIPLPPLSEQRRIVDILREADELRRLRSQSINKLEKLFQSLFFHYFETGKANSKYSQTIKLKELLAVPLTSGYSPNTHNEPPGIPVFGLSAITNFGLDPMKIKYYPEKTYKGKGDDLQPDDILVTRSNTQELVGKVARYRGEPSPVIYPDLMIRIRLKDSKDSPYVESFLRSVYMTDIIQRLARGTSGSMKKISQKDINDFDILYPPEKDRYEYADRVRELEQLYEYYSLDAKKLDDLFQSLLAQAFTGELTATWREQHEEELAAAAAERDRLLQISQPVNVEELADEEASETKISELHRDRYELLRSLSKSQWKIYELVIQETAYFTPEHLEEKYSISRNIGQKSLQLLAAAGLIVPVTLPTPTSSGLHYESAYRNLNQDENTLYSDVALLTKDAV